MYNFYRIKLIIIPGAIINDVLKQANEIRLKYKTDVVFNFNGVQFFIYWKHKESTLKLPDNWINQNRVEFT